MPNQLFTLLLDREPDDDEFEALVEAGCDDAMFATHGGEPVADFDREAVRRYTTGERGPGGFPRAVNPESERSIFYRWSEVAPWLRDKLGLDVEDPDPTLLVANNILQARKHRDRVANMKALTDLLVA